MVEQAAPNFYDAIRSILDKINEYINPILVSLALIYQVYRDRRKKSEENNIKKKENLSNNVDVYNRIIAKLETNYENIIMENKFPWEYALDINFDLQDYANKELLNEYKRQYDLCSDLCYACRYILKTNAYDAAKQWMPNTLSKNGINNIICDENTMPKFLNGEKVSVAWFRDKFNSKYYQIMGTVDQEEGEKSLDEFLKLFNETIINDRIIIRYRKEKTLLIEIYEKLIKNLKNKIKNIENEINKL